MDATLRRDVEALHQASFDWAMACCRFERTEAEDVLQSVYLKLLDGRARWDGHSTLKTFLFAVIRRSALDRRRRQWLWSLGLDRLRRLWPRPGGVHSAEPPDGGDDPLLRARVQAALEELAPRQHEVLELVFYQGLTIQEAAEVMGVSLGAARVHYDRGKRRMAERLR